MKNELSLHSIPGSGISSSVVEVKAHRLASLRGGGFYFISLLDKVPSLFVFISLFNETMLLEAYI